MARLIDKALFFTTSPRTPSKMIPEIHLLQHFFEGQKWDSTNQEKFIDKLAETDFFEGKGSPSDKAFSARDRINRAPKALGFINLDPAISLTDAGKEFVFGKRPQEIFLRQLLKFQLPSPYHIEAPNIQGTFFVKPYLEIIRLIRELEYLTFDELKIFALQLTNYHEFERIKSEIQDFRIEKQNHAGEYKRFVQETWTKAILRIYHDNISSGKLKTRETPELSLSNFISTKKSNLRDYADACFRYLRFTGLITISHKNRTISIFEEKTQDVDFILDSIDRNPRIFESITDFKEYLFTSNYPELFVDQKENIIDSVMRLSSYTKRDLLDLSVIDLKDLLDQTTRQRKDMVLTRQIDEIKSYSLYSEIIDTFNEIISDEYFDAPLMFEYNTWRAMTMLDGGIIKGNFKFDDIGQPMSTAQGNMPDIECDYEDFMLSVEVTLQSGQRQYENEGEPVARHYGQLLKKTGKDTYCLFIAPSINQASLAHFYALNRMEIAYYGGKTKIVPIDLDQFMCLVENSYTSQGHPNPNDVRRFLDDALEKASTAIDENDWKDKIQQSVTNWLKV
jgi:hypothetical protein